MPSLTRDLRHSAVAYIFLTCLAALLLTAFILPRLIAPGLAAPTRGAVRPGLSSPAKAIHTFATALNTADLKLAVACVYGAKANAAKLAEVWSVNKRMVRKTYTIDHLHISVKGNRATAQLQVSLKLGEETRTREERLQLRRDRQQWTIIPPARQAIQPSAGFLQDEISIIAYPDFYTDIFFVARGNARRFVCTDQIREIALAARKLTEQRGGRFTAHNSSLKKTLMPLTNKDIFRCGEDTGAGESYSFNRNLANVPLKSIKDSSSTVLIYEGRNGKLAFRHRRARTPQPLALVTFVDSHVEEITPSQAVALKWKP